MFCACKNVEDGTTPNTAICPICTGQPGALPALNATAIQKGVLAGLALECTIPDQSAFDRKNYFYPDLPKGYQISQFYLPIAVSGRLSIDVLEKALPERANPRIGITRIHLEEDAAKNVHATEGLEGRPATLVDFNRAGTPLIEIVTEPDLRSSQEAKAFLQELRGLLRAIGVSQADMEKGQMRCDANISLMEVDEKGFPISQTLNPRTEIKNLNSFRAVERALEYEMQRQGALYDNGTPPIEATRGWDDQQGKTLEQRSKETSADYRYFPEPDLPPQDLTDIREAQKNNIPELPAETRNRLQKEYGFPIETSNILISQDGWLEYAEKVMGELGGWMESATEGKESGSDILERRKDLAKRVSGWLTSKLAGYLAEQKKTITEANITPENFAEFITIVDKGTINSTNGQKLLKLMMETGKDPSDLMETHTLGQDLESEELEKIVARNLEANPKQRDALKNGKEALAKWFVGIVMRDTEGRADPQKTEEEIKRQIQSINE